MSLLPKPSRPYRVSMAAPWGIVVVDVLGVSANAAKRAARIEFHRFVVLSAVRA